MSKNVDVIIPIHKPDKRLEYALYELAQQKICPQKVILVESETIAWESIPVAIPENLKIVEVKTDAQEEAGFWNEGLLVSDAEYVLFLAENAVPSGETFLNVLLRGFSDEQVVCVYGRQVAEDNLSEKAKGMQNYIYPAVSKKKQLSQLAATGMNLFACSNQCAVYRRTALEEMGHFLLGSLALAESIWVADALYNGYQVRYEGKAQVQCSRPSTAMLEMRRMFDMSAAYLNQQHIFGAYVEKTNPSAVRAPEGIVVVASLNQMIRRQISFTYGYLVKRFNPIQAISMTWTGMLMTVGCYLGKKNKYLPKQVCRFLSQNKSYWV